MARTTLHNAAFTMAGQLTARLLALLFYAVLARAFGPERYGDQGLGVAMGTLFVALLEPGLNLLLVRDGARSGEALEERLSQALGYKLWMLLLAWPASVATAALLGYRDEPLWAVALAGGTILLGSIEDVSAAALTALERLDVEGFLRTLSKVLTAGLGLTTLLLGGDFVHVLGAVCLGAGCAGVAGLLLVRRCGVRVRLAGDPRAAARWVLSSWPLAVTTVLWWLTLRMDQLLASLLGVDHDQLGNYNAAVKLVEALMLFPGAVATAFQPVISRTWLEGPQSCSRPIAQAMAASLALSVAIAVGGATLADDLGALVYGDRFQGVGLLLAVQLLYLPILGVQYIGMHTLVAAGAVERQALGMLVNFIVNVVCNLVLVPRYGILGASLSALCGGMASVIVFHRALRGLELRPGLLAAAWRPAVAATAMGTAVILVRDHLPLAADIAIGAVVYGAVLWLVGGADAVLAIRRARSPV